MTPKYKAEAAKLAQAVTIAIDALQKFMPVELDAKQRQRVVSYYLHIEKNLSHPEPNTQTLSYLKDETNFVFTYFNEGSGEAVDYFWKRLKEEDLDYKRVNKLEKIVKRKKIVNQEEFDFVTDTIVHQLQQGEISKEQFESLSIMIGNFEKRKR